MDMTGERRIPAPRQVVWSALNDPEVLRVTLPGCESLEKQSDTAMKAIASVKIGPISARFTGNVQLSDMDPPNGYTISGEGQGGVAGFAKGSAKVMLEDDAGITLLRYEVHAQVGGKLAQLGARLVDATAKQLADQFFDRFSARVAPAAAVAPAEMLEAPPLPVSVAPSATQVSAMPAAPPTAGTPPAAAITPAGATTPAAATAAAAFAAAQPATASAPPPSQAAPVFPAAPSPGHPPTTTRSFPSAPGSVVSDQVLPPPYPSASISIFSLIPREPFGLPIAAWIGGLVYLFILLLFIGSIL